MPFRLFAAKGPKSEKNARPKKNEKTKKRHAIRQNNENTKPVTRNNEILARKAEQTPREKTPFETFNRLFAWRLFVFSQGVFSSFCVALFRLVVLFALR